MLKNEREKKIHEKYKKRDKDGNVHCDECPLVVFGEADCMCKANSHYDRKRKGVGIG